MATGTIKSSFCNKLLLQSQYNYMLRYTELLSFTCCFQLETQTYMYASSWHSNYEAFICFVETSLILVLYKYYNSALFVDKSYLFCFTLKKKFKTKIYIHQEFLFNI